VVAAALYLVAVGLFFEVSARLALTSDAFFERIAINDDVSWRHRWLRRQGDRPQLFYGFDIHDPVRGWAVKPGLRDLRVWGDRSVSTNSRGLRGAAEHAYARRPGVPRIVALGDSFTFGDEVGDAEAWPQQLARRLPGVEVLNLGVHGYGHDQMLLYLQEEGVRYRPDVVLLGFLSDDMERNVLAFRDYAKPRFELRDGRLVLQNVPVPAPAETLAAEAWRSKLMDLVGILRASARWRSGFTPRHTRDLSAAILDEIARTASSVGARPVFAYLPVYGEIDKPEISMTRRERWFFDHCQDRGIEALYLRPTFLEELAAGTELKTWGHWGPVEHAVAAEAISRLLVERGLVTPPDPTP
jgi:lysophospholipase L1-like esterase